MSFAINLFKSYFLAEKQPGVTTADLDLNFNPKSTILKLEKSWKSLSFNDVLHYSTLTFFLTLAFILNPLHFLLKSLVVGLLILGLLIPFTSQFLLNALPILTWLAFFFTSTGIPKKYRPPISVKVLPALETIFYGDNLSQLLATSTSPILDILAWLPYGLIHFALPFIVAVFLFLWGPPTCLRSFGFAFGYMNLAGVLIQIFFPAAPPWYKILHGLEPANYSMDGSPGGLARIDELLHLDLYTTNFTKNSPVVFGAFPSLHSGCATMDILFLCYVFPKFAPVFSLYVLWLWWSTMYLTHHYFIDLIAGSLLSFVVFEYTKYKHLPINDLKAKNRWSYTEIKKPNIFKMDPLSVVSLDDDLEASIGADTNGVLTRARSHSIRQNAIELNVISRASRLNSSANVEEIITEHHDDFDDDQNTLDKNDSILEDPELSSPESTGFDSDIPRSVSRSSQTSVESQYDISIPTSFKARRD